MSDSESEFDENEGNVSSKDSQLYSFIWKVSNSSKLFAKRLPLELVMDLEKFCLPVEINLKANTAKGWDMDEESSPSFQELVMMAIGWRDSNMVLESSRIPMVHLTAVTGSKTRNMDSESTFTRMATFLKGLGKMTRSKALEPTRINLLNFLSKLLGLKELLKARSRSTMETFVITAIGMITTRSAKEFSHSAWNTCCLVMWKKCSDLSLANLLPTRASRYSR